MQTYKEYKLQNLIEYKCSFCNKNYQQKFDKKVKSDFLVHTNFLTMITIGLFHCCKKVFILINIWMIGKNQMKHYYWEKKTFTVTSI